ncbi:hypothetical protein HETIRDRAFT_439553 [Heterobasidion irregulare TC 32-1]|uniref:Putative gamma-glutamylcyclotransferase n=1 Tax=Heterobasidion irregulare (strain TC 32-1) TaxID=747525 RepID=W4KB10_HETIT|nr:uncharacterized protein HETIRDRAFT_439553 [Heterobasidion irregulare TC 32-1]ETW82978.1 hypothetical protein HETIRDRAFT_439553 [Heterobasidion irregulare TC 32-1]
MSSAFFYGTLLHPTILTNVIGNDGGHLELCPAVLMDHTRHHVKRADYPAVLPYAKSKQMFDRDLNYEERSVRGTLVIGLTESDIRLLDLFEGNEYERTPVFVHPLAPFLTLPSSVVPTSEAQLSVAPPTAPPLPLPSELAEAVPAETYIWIDKVTYLDAKLWSYDDFIKEKLHNWVGKDNEEYKEVQRRIEMQGNIVRDFSE